MQCKKNLLCTLTRLDVTWGLLQCGMGMSPAFLGLVLDCWTWFGFSRFEVWFLGTDTGSSRASKFDFDRWWTLKKSPILLLVGSSNCLVFGFFLSFYSRSEVQFFKGKKLALWFQVRAIIISCCILVSLKVNIYSIEFLLKKVKIAQ